MNLIAQFSEATTTAIGFFWKAGWAFVLGYGVSAMIQAFVPRGRLTPLLGSDGPASVSLATVFGAASSSCSFAALATARSLVMKGAHFVAAVAFMFASTNLVIELGVLIVIFLGWQFLAAELAGGLTLIVISSLLMRATYPTAWMQSARKSVEAEAGDDDDTFDWRARIRSREGWHQVGHHFVSDWKMVWEEVLIGFTVAGCVAVFVPPAFWERLFLVDVSGAEPGLLVVIENAVVAPLVAGATFIGSMGNIPLATVLNANGVLFAGIMGFIYSDLMVPPLVMINARYYGWRVALYIAGVMFVSIVVTALIMHYAFAALAITPHSARQVDEVTRFGLDYTFYLNVASALLATMLVRLHIRHRGRAGHDTGHRILAGLGPKRLIALGAGVLIVVGQVVRLVGPGPS